MVRKKRTRQHVIADLGVNHVEKQILLCGHTVERVVHDYGYDLFVFTFDAEGYTEPGSIGVQVKATEKPLNDVITFRIERSDLIHWLSEQRPVLLVIYSLLEDKAYYLDVRDYFANPNFNIFTAGQTITVQISRDRLFEQSAVKLIVDEKNKIVGGAR